MFELMFGKSTFLHPSPVRHCSAVSLLLTYLSYLSWTLGALGDLSHSLNCWRNGNGSVRPGRNPKVVLFPHFTEGESEGQRRVANYSRSHSQSEAELSSNHPSGLWRPAQRSSASLCHFLSSPLF